MWLEGMVFAVLSIGHMSYFMRVQPDSICLSRVENRGKPLGGYVVGTKHGEKDGRWCVRCGVSVDLVSFRSFFSGRFYPCLRRLLRQQLWLCRVEKIRNVFVWIVTCVSRIVGVVRVHVAAVLCLASVLINFLCNCRVACQALRTPRPPNVPVAIVSETQSMCIMVLVQGPERIKQLHTLALLLGFTRNSKSGWLVTSIAFSCLSCFALCCFVFACVIVCLIATRFEIAS